MIPDYIKLMGAELKPELNMTGTYGLFYQDQAAVFYDIESEMLRQNFNEAMHLAVSYYTINSEKYNLKIKERQIQDMSFIVVIHSLRLFSLWRHNSEEHKDLPLRIEKKDLLHVQSQDIVWFYCAKEFDAIYIKVTAGLLDMTEEEFLRYMQGRNLFFDIH